MDVLCSAIVRCSVHGSKYSCEHVKVSFFLSGEGGIHPVDIELAAAREARRQGYVVESVCFIERVKADAVADAVL